MRSAGRMRKNQKNKRIAALAVGISALILGAFGLTYSLSGEKEAYRPGQEFENSQEIHDTEIKDNDNQNGSDNQEGIWEKEKEFQNPIPKATEDVSESEVKKYPAYNGQPYIIIEGAEPCFSAQEITAESYEYYGELDELGRCTGAIACIGIDLMPTEERSMIVSVKPTGWQSTQYDFIDQKYLYNRCHLLAYQLTGENANERNLITGTRYLNITGMLPFENQIRNYVKDTGNHVMYRVTPMFNGDNLIADGVRMEAYSVEDAGKEIQFCVYCYNVQPGVVINYADGSSVSDGTVTAEMLENAGSSWYDEAAAKEAAAQYYDENGTEYVLNVRRMKIHRPECDSVAEMSPKNSYEIKAIMQVLMDAGYEPCKNCRPE